MSELLGDTYSLMLLVKSSLFVPPFDFLGSFIVVFDKLRDKVKIIVFGNHVPHHFFAVLAPVENFESLFLVLFDVDGFHKAQTGTLPVAGHQFVDVQ